MAHCRPARRRCRRIETLDFTSGPLAHLRDLLEKVNCHDRRATVRVPVGGEDKTITLSYRLNGRQETEVMLRLVTPRSVESTADIFLEDSACIKAGNGEARP